MSTSHDLPRIPRQGIGNTPQDHVAKPGHLRLNSAAMSALDDHLAWMRLRGLRPATITQRRNAIVRLSRRLPVPLLEATADHLNTWALGLTGSPAYLANSLANVCQFYGWLYDTDRLPVDPARKLVRPKVHKGIPRPLSEASLDVAISTAPDDVRCWLILGAYAGLRAGEMARLQRKDILDTAAVPCLVLDGKGGKQRVVPASPRVLFELRAYGLPSRGLVFRRRDGRPGAVTPARVSQLVNGHLHDLGLTDTGHAARHRFATSVYGLSRDLRLVQELLGHGDPATTSIYTQFAQEEAAGFVAALK